jgi:hypothetical protein
MIQITAHTLLRCTFWHLLAKNCRLNLPWRRGAAGTQIWGQICPLVHPYVAELKCGLSPRISDGAVTAAWTASTAAAEVSVKLRVIPLVAQARERVSHVTLSIVGFDDLVTSFVATIATGWSDPYWVELFPTARPRLRHRALTQSY